MVTSFKYNLSVRRSSDGVGGHDVPDATPEVYLPGTDLGVLHRLPCEDSSFAGRCVESLERCAKEVVHIQLAGGAAARAQALGRLHDLLMDLVRFASLLHPEHTTAGDPIHLPQAFALHELDTSSPLSQSDLASRLRLEKSTVSRLVAELEHKGLVVRERDPGNRRYFRVRLTDRGRALHAEMSAEFHARYARLVSGMTAAERDALLIGLPALIRALRDEVS